MDNIDHPTDYENESFRPMPSWTDFIIYHKRQLRLSTRAFADHIGVVRETVYYWIRNPTVMPQDHIRKQVESRLMQRWVDYDGPTRWDSRVWGDCFPVVLRGLIEDSGLEIVVLAGRAGINQNNIYNWMNGLSFPTLVSLSLIVEVLGDYLPITKGQIYLKLHKSVLKTL